MKTIALIAASLTLRAGRRVLFEASNVLGLFDQ